MDNAILKIMRERRSIRKYKKEQITEEQLQAILEAGTYAPTGMGAQSPLILAVQEPEVISLLSRLNAAVMGTDSDPFYGAPTVLVVLADRNRPTYVEDGSLVIGNMLNEMCIRDRFSWVPEYGEERPLRFLQSYTG